jgi:hypothetical protein
MIKYLLQIRKYRNYEFKLNSALPRHIFQSAAYRLAHGITYMTCP